MGKVSNLYQQNKGQWGNTVMLTWETKTPPAQSAQHSHRVYSILLRHSIKASLLRKVSRWSFCWREIKFAWRKSIEKIDCSSLVVLAGSKSSGAAWHNPMSTQPPPSCWQHNPPGITLQGWWTWCSGHVIKKKIKKKNLFHIHSFCHLHNYTSLNNKSEYIWQSATRGYGIS